MPFAGSAEIRKDIYSEANKLEVYEHVKATQESELVTISQTFGGFSSAHGIYLRVKKPLEAGAFHFVFGVYKQLGFPSDRKSLSIDFAISNEAREPKMIGWGFKYNLQYFYSFKRNFHFFKLSLKS